MRRIENFDRKPPGTALGPGERKFDQLKNIPNSGNIDLWEEDGLSSKFEKTIEEIIEDCQEIRQIVLEAEKAVSGDAGLSFDEKTTFKGAP
jgi:hypothetical protein